MMLRRAVLAVLPLFVLLVAAPADAGRAEPPAQQRLGIPRTYDAALAHFDHATEMRALKKFYTPSGNIYCNVGLTGYPRGCEINQGQVHDPAACAGNHESKDVGRLEIRRNRVLPVCNTDTIQTRPTKVLPYGQATTAGGIACISEEIGVTCISLKRTLGFFVHRGEYVIFNAG
jgi:hypothetical protein